MDGDGWGASVKLIDLQLAQLRGCGWSVAVHNDYRLDGRRLTFWLFTHPSGWWAKGEGTTDFEALEQVISEAKSRPTSSFGR